ncbi:MAG: hypothetical protein WBQ60_00600 [Asticcacaulis sp.]
MGQMSISLDEEAGAWVQSQAGDAEAYVNGLVHQDQERKLGELKQAIQDGLNSGISERNVDDIWAQAKQRHQAKYG